MYYQNVQLHHIIAVITVADIFFLAATGILIPCVCFGVHLVLGKPFRFSQANNKCAPLDLCSIELFGEGSLWSVTTVDVQSCLQGWFYISHTYSSQHL